MKTILNQLSPYIRKAWNHKEFSGFYAGPRVIFDYELLYLAKGKLHVEIEQDSFTLEEGEMILIKPGKLHRFHTISDGLAWMPHIHFDAIYDSDSEGVPINQKMLSDCSPQEIAMIRPDILGSGGLDIPDQIRIRNHGEVFKTLQELIEIYEKKDPDQNMILYQKYLTLKILFIILDGSKETTVFTKHSKNLERAADYIIENYNQSIEMDHLAKISCLSVFHFQRLFREKYKLPPIKFQNRYRIEKAKELMTYTQLSLSMIAEKTGYGSIHAFSKFFRNMEGISPSEYLKRCR